MNKTQPWIHSARFDTSFILFPAILITTLVLVFHSKLNTFNTVSPWLWLLLIVGIDVSHVYSTLFRTYLDKEEFQQRQALYILTPLFGWIIGCFLYTISSLTFWRALTYLAVFHFIRQQLGFMMIYARNEHNNLPYSRLIDKTIIYLATLYPIIYWHCKGRNFEWFIKDDFFILPNTLPSYVAIFYISIFAIYIVKEFIQWRRTHTFNIPKNLLLFGTAFSWFVGIVAFNNDLIFTATNVIAHGIPYMALIWIYGHNQVTIQNSTKNTFRWTWVIKLFQPKAIPFFVAILFTIAFLEEGLWDHFIWQEHHLFFDFMRPLPFILDKNTLIWLVPLLTLPQITHYILDAFIWRLKSPKTNWKQILFYNTKKS